MIYRRVTINLSEDEYQRLITKGRESYQRTAGGFARSIVLEALAIPQPAILEGIAEQLDVFKKQPTPDFFKKSTARNRKAKR
jgi:hypothetical protein